MTRRAKSRLKVLYRSQGMARLSFGLVFAANDNTTEPRRYAPWLFWTDDTQPVWIMIGETMKPRLVR